MPETLAWKFPIPTAVSAKSAKLSVQNADVDENEERAHPLVATTGGAGLIVVGGPNPDNETYTVTLKPGAGVWTSAGYRSGYRLFPSRRRYCAGLGSIRHLRK